MTLPLCAAAAAAVLLCRWWTQLCAPSTCRCRRSAAVLLCSPSGGASGHTLRCLLRAALLAPHLLTHSASHLLIHSDSTRLTTAAATGSMGGWVWACMSLPLGCMCMCMCCVFIFHGSHVGPLCNVQTGSEWGAASCVPCACAHNASQEQQNENETNNNKQEHMNVNRDQQSLW